MGKKFYQDCHSPSRQEFLLGGVVVCKEAEMNEWCLMRLELPAEMDQVAQETNPQQNLAHQPRMLHQG